MSYIKYADKWHEVDLDAAPLPRSPQTLGFAGRNQHVLTLKCCGRTAPNLTQWDAPMEVELLCDGAK